MGWRLDYPGQSSLTWASVFNDEGNIVGSRQRLEVGLYESCIFEFALGLRGCDFVVVFVIVYMRMRMWNGVGGLCECDMV